MGGVNEWQGLNLKRALSTKIRALTIVLKLRGITKGIFAVR